MRNIIRKSIYIGISIYICAAIISCEEDFTDIDTNVISNTKFTTNSLLVDISASNSPLEKLQTDNISRQINQYLLGVYANSDYEKIEASIISQLGLPTDFEVVDIDDLSDSTTVLTKIDTVFLKLPYPVSINGGTEFELEETIGETNKPYTLNVFRSNTFINRFNPADPTKTNSYNSDDEFEKIGEALNVNSNFSFTPSLNDTMIVVKRRLFDNTVINLDTVKIFNSAVGELPIPFARVPLNKEVFKELFLDKYESSDFDSQEAFNNYFRGIILEASGNQGSLTTYNFNTSVASLNPSIEIYYTNSVFNKGTTDTIKTVRKNSSFTLSGFRINKFKMEDKTYPVNNEIKIQGAAGSEANVTLFTTEKLNELRNRNLLINDASLTFYINQSADTASVPERLYLYKSNEELGNLVFSQVKDALTESAFGGINGFLLRDANGKKEKYTFKITDYVSDLINGTTDYSPTLKIKAFNSSDVPINDTIFRNFSWNPRAVTLLNNATTNGDKKAILKISYSERKDN